VLSVHFAAWRTSETGQGWLVGWCGKGAGWILQVVVVVVIVVVDDDDDSWYG
jgi:uncharacterized membrane protein YoaT (DUF817 family)